MLRLCQGGFHEEHTIHMSLYKPYDNDKKYICSTCCVGLIDHDRLVFLYKICDEYGLCHKCSKKGFQNIDKGQFTKLRVAQLPHEDTEDSDKNEDENG